MTRLKPTLHLLACGLSLIGCTGETDEVTDTDTVDTDTDTSSPVYTVEGRWIESTLLNTMYEFDGQVRRTYYCVLEDPTDCDEAYWASLGSEDAIPEENPYTFDGTTLTIDLFFGNVFEKQVTFACEGDKLLLEDYVGSWHRPNRALSDCPD